MRRYLKKPRALPIKRLVALLTELNNYQLLFPESNTSNNMEEGEINEIILHTIPDSWAQTTYLQGWNFKSRGYWDTHEMFEHMETAEQVYKGGKSSKNNQNRADANCDSYSRTNKGGGS